MRILFLVLALLCSSTNGHAYTMNSRLGHFYFAFGPNFGMQGNIRLGVGDVVEVGVIQNTGFGVMFLRRTSSSIFLQAGPILSNGGGISIGGGLEGNTSSWFRVRSDITVNSMAGFETQAVVTLGGVFIL